MSKHKRKGKKRNKVFKVSRWLHVYCSTSLFALLIFFCITGITLNHRWYDQAGNIENYQESGITHAQYESWNLKLGKEWQPDTTAIIADLQSEYGLKSPTSMDLDADLGELIIEYRVPAGFATVIIDAGMELLIIETESGSTLGILNDLHKGRHSGTVWFWIIDISAVLMVIFSITGIIILFQGKKYRQAGLISAIAGLLTPFAIYFLFVPSV